MSKQIKRGAVAAGALAAGAANAAVDAGITSAITTAGTDSVTVASALTIVAVGVWAALYLKRKFFG